MKLLLSPLFIICLVLFAAHQVLQKGLHMHHPWLDSYLDNLLAMPVILSLWRLEQSILFKKGPAYKLSVLAIAAATFWVSLVSEIVFPILSDDFWRDPFDVLYYTIGSVIFYLYQNLHKQK